MRNNLGPRIRLARKRRKLTQEALAARLQVKGLSHSRNTVAKIEAGIRQITDIEIRAIAEALDVTIAWLFQENDE